MNSKIQNGQFYTLRSPFGHELFRSWIKEIPNISEKIFVEPFGGANNIILLAQPELNNVSLSQWRSYDLEPEKILQNQVPKIVVTQNDSIKNMPAGDVCITNPPYLAKNSATRMGMNVDFQNFQDLWELSVHLMLKNFDYVAAIIPESFITRNLFKERLYGVISITKSLFDDTGHPVCLALWVKNEQKDFPIYVDDKLIGNFYELKKNSKIENLTKNNNLKIKFNDPNGILGLSAVDLPSKMNIKFMSGTEISSDNIKGTSRAYTRITVSDKKNNLLITNENLNEVIKKLNQEIDNYRKETKDVFLTNFKSLRTDGFYRRRLDWDKASRIIQTVFDTIK